MINTIKIYYKNIIIYDLYEYISGEKHDKEKINNSEIKNRIIYKKSFK